MAEALVTSVAKAESECCRRSTACMVSNTSLAMEEYKLNINKNKRGLIWRHIGNEADEHAEGKGELYLHILCQIVLSWQRIEKCSKTNTTDGWE
jgi:hypothetical protein